MKSILIGLVCSVSSFSAYAFSYGQPSWSKEEFCADREDRDYVKVLASYPNNLMGFRNHGGIGNGGVCWWHARFQRNSLYLTYYQPNEKKDSNEVVLGKIKKIRAGKEVVIINGFSDFYEFSSVYSDEIQRELEKWQKSDGIVKFKWMKGLKGKPVVSPEKFKIIMDQLYEDVMVKKNIVYQKLQVKGIAAHSWLVVNMNVTSTGYDLLVIDSNIPNELMLYSYNYGDTNFQHFVYGNFTPYTENENELVNIKNVISSKCRK